MKLTFAYFLAFLLLAGTQLTAQKGYQVGDVAQEINLKNIDENMVSTETYQDAKGFILIVTCNTCPYAQMYEDRIQALHEKFGPKGYPVLAINPNDPVRKPGDSFSAMKDRAIEKGFTFPYLMDETQEVAKAFGATRTPEVNVVERTDEGLVVRYKGAIDDNPRSASQVETHYVDDAVQALLDGKEVKLDKTVSVGCTIKWRQA